MIDTLSREEWGYEIRTVVLRIRDKRDGTSTGSSMYYYSYLVLGDDRWFVLLVVTLPVTREYPAVIVFSSGRRSSIVFLCSEINLHHIFLYFYMQYKYSSK